MVDNKASIIVEGIISVAVNTSLSVNNYVVLASGAITVTLPVPETSRGAHYIIKKTDSDATAVTIATSGSEKIDNDSSLELSSQFQTVDIVCDGTKWHKIGIAG